MLNKLMDIKETIFPSKICHEHDNFLIKDLALDSAIEIDCYMREREISSNAFSKLAKILYNTLTPRDFLKGKRPIDEYGTLCIFIDVLKEYGKEEKEKGREVPYEFDIGQETIIAEIANKITPVIYTLSKDLASFATLPDQKKENLKDFCLTLDNVLASYSWIGKHSLVA